jgi:7-cyano-7-deazaguanine synthase
VVLLSGGLDSATVLAVARDRGYACHAISYDYGQRHGAELEASRRVATELGAVEHKVVRLDLGSIGGSALTDDAIDVPETPSEGIPVTYVPARNTVFLAIALGWAEVLGARDLFIGVNAVDYSGYPDSNRWPTSPPRPAWRASGSVSMHRWSTSARPTSSSVASSWASTTR